MGGAPARGDVGSVRGVLWERDQALATGEPRAGGDGGGGTTLARVLVEAAARGEIGRAHV